MDNEDLEKRRYEVRNRNLSQARSYLGMAKEKNEQGDQEGEEYWRGRTLERLTKCVMCPISFEWFG